MRDIGHKTFTQRVARASAVVKMQASSVDAVKANTGPKPDIIGTARAAGFLAVKNTPSVIPHCHPLPIEHVIINFEFEKERIKITVEVKTIYKTGCEVEAMYGASVAALTIYDMLKPVDKSVEITSIKLESKSGGKTDFRQQSASGIKAAVIVCSDSISAGKKQDRAGKAIMEKLQSYGLSTPSYEVIPDEIGTIRTRVKHFHSLKTDLLIITGGTGLSPTDVTPEALKPLIERDIPGIMEAARSYGQDRTPYAMLSRSKAGLIGRMLVLALPGSTSGASESMDALFPEALHIFKVLEKGYAHGG